MFGLLIILNYFIASQQTEIQPNNRSVIISKFYDIVAHGSGVYSLIRSNTYHLLQKIKSAFKRKWMQLRGYPEPTTMESEQEISEEDLNKLKELLNEFMKQANFEFDENKNEELENGEETKEESKAKEDELEEKEEEEIKEKKEEVKEEEEQKVKEML